MMIYLFFLLKLGYNSKKEGDFMFVDETKIEVIAGTGGEGCMAYRREKFIPMGGPFGGSGGKGGDIVFVADEGLKTLIDLKYRHKFVGNNGFNGQGKNQNGKNGENTYIKVPVGTVVREVDSNFIIADLIKQGEEVTVAKGGRGGRGNVALATRSNPCPNVAERGEPGEKKVLKIELRVMADVGLIGMPSVGKSTILSMISSANPKIGAYHFTTLSPNLGVVTTKKRQKFIVADLPGLIEGASEGIGLGHQFLRHATRTKVLCHVLDMSASEGRDPYEDYCIINKELEEYDAQLFSKPQIIIANKMDLPTSKENMEKFKKEVKDIPIFEISAMNNQGLEEVITYLGDLVSQMESTPLFEEEKIESHVLYQFKKELPFTITKEGASWVVKGEQVEKLLRMSNFNTEEALVRFATKLKKMGIDDKLEELGAQEGDVVRILNYEFTYEK